MLPVKGLGACPGEWGDTGTHRGICRRWGDAPEVGDTEQEVWGTSSDGATLFLYYLV